MTNEDSHQRIVSEALADRLVELIEIEDDEQKRKAIRGLLIQALEDGEVYESTIEAYLNEHGDWNELFR